MRANDELVTSQRVADQDRVRPVGVQAPVGGVGDRDRPDAASAIQRHRFIDRKLNDLGRAVAQFARERRYAVEALLHAGSVTFEIPSFIECCAPTIDVVRYVVRQRCLVQAAIMTPVGHRCTKIVRPRQIRDLVRKLSMFSLIFQPRKTMTYCRAMLKAGAPIACRSVAGLRCLAKPTLQDMTRRK